MPSPLKKSFAAELLKQRQKKSKTTKIVAISIIIAVAAVVYALFMHFGEKEIPPETTAPPGEETPIKSIAVLPIVNMSADPDQENLCY